MALLYSFTTQEFGRLQVAGPRSFALEVRRRFRGAGPIQAVAIYKRCDSCDSKPCCCQRRAPTSIERSD